MRPRIFKRHGLWYCKIDDGTIGGVVGIGYSPEHAYADWEIVKRQRKFDYGNSGHLSNLNNALNHHHANLNRP